MAKQNILLAITGLAPQVVTETNAIYMAGKPLPDRVIIITTQTGKDKARFAISHNSNMIKIKES